jgi:NADH-quinone oxidoreductase subunit N
MSADGLFLAALPEHLLLAGLLAILVSGLLSKAPRDPFPLALATVLAAGGAALWLRATGFEGAPFPGHFSVGGDVLAAKALLAALTVPVLFLTRAERLNDRFAMLLLCSLYGAYLMVSADSLLLLFFGLEMLSLPLYALVVLGYQRPESAEAAMKYLVIGGVGTATLLMGISLVLGATGGLAVSDFAAAMASDTVFGRAGVALIVAAFMLKSAIVPFHAWAPDAYEAATVPVTAFMATLVKGAVLLALVRLFGAAEAGPALLGVLVALPLVSMTWGNLEAMRQDSFRRLVAYSSIAHAGYLFYALLGAPEARFEAVAFYVLVYGLTTTLALACLPTGPDGLRDRLEELKGLYHRAPLAAILIAISMLSLAGIPPFPGFVAKFVIFRAVMDAGLFTVAVLGLVASYLGIYLYLRVIQTMFMSAAPGEARTVPAGGIAMGAAVMMLVAILAIGLLPGWALGWF